MPEQHDGGQLFVKSSKSTRNVQDPFPQPTMGMQNMSAIGMSQSSSLMTEDISNMKDLQQQIQSKLSDMQRGQQPSTSAYSVVQRQSAKHAAGDGSSSRASGQ